MHIKKTPIAVAVSIAFLMISTAYADGGEIGSNGTTTPNLNPIDGIKNGATGVNGGSTDGGDAADVTAKHLTIGSESDPMLVITGTPGSAGGDVTSYGGGGGAGGHGGGLVFGGISTGGAAGYSYSSFSANGGNGGDITGNTIEIINSTLIGAAAGDGGSVTSTSGGGGGAAGHGGGSVFGGISTGGAAGFSYSPRTSRSANGGNGGDVTGNTIEITNSTLTGAAAGDGGSVTYSSGGGGGAAGHGGGAVFGGISTAGAAGFSSTSFSVKGGNGGDVTGNTIEITNSTLTGAAAGDGGSVTSSGGGGAAGHGGGSVFGGISTGGAAGFSSETMLYTTSASGGNGGDVTGNTIEITNATLTGAAVGDGGSVISSSPLSGGGGAAGNGGGSVFGGISTGGAAGFSTSTAPSDYSSVNGGNGGNIKGNQITLTDVELDASGSPAGDGGSVTSTSGGGGGAAGHGGGSVFGGISTGGAAGSSYNVLANGGTGGDVTGNTIEITNSTLTGAAAGDGGSVTSSSTTTSYGGGGAAGHGGGSVFGGISTGGAAGYTSSVSVNGGNGGDVTGNTIEITNSTLTGAAAGDGGSVTSSYGGGGAAGHGGGSVFGGISTGGAAGFSYSPRTSRSANGGNGGDVSDNQITISGESKISGSIYGGISQGGAKGKLNVLGNVTDGIDGKGGFVKNNTITLIGDKISISGDLYGGLSKNGDGKENIDPEYKSFYAGNTIQIQSGHFELKGKIKNFQNYNWLLPENEFNGDVIITVASTGTAVDINNTIHKVDVAANGNTLDGGDQVILISKVTGDFDREKSAAYIEQGFFVVYDAEMDVQDVTVDGSTNTGLVLNVIGANDNNPENPDNPDNPDGRIHPESEEFFKGRIAQLAMVDQGTDMISDGISYARASLRKENANIFAIVDGGSSKYKNGGVSTLKLNDFKFALGAAKAFEFDNKSVGMISAFSEHGNGNYNSYNYFDYFGDTRGSGKVRYSGVGLMGHLDVAGTDVSKVKNKPNIFDDKYGLYLDAALRVGHVKVDFHSADMVNRQGVEARYNTKSRYSSAMLGAGYVWTMDEKSAMDFYGRFTFSRMNGKDIQVVDEQMNAGSAHSKRLRLGARYGYAYSATTTPYAGVAFERNFTGDVSGSAYGFTIKENSLKGNTGILEAGVMIKPKGADDPFSLRVGLQGYFGQRKGATADVRARYVF